jgi:hypothetical protein
MNFYLMFDINATHFTRSKRIDEKVEDVIHDKIHWSTWCSIRSVTWDTLDNLTGVSTWQTTEDAIFDFTWG